jgi:hypothetical protein
MKKPARAAGFFIVQSLLGMWYIFPSRTTVIAKTGGHIGHATQYVIPGCLPKQSAQTLCEPNLIACLVYKTNHCRTRSQRSKKTKRNPKNDTDPR